MSRIVLSFLSNIASGKPVILSKLNGALIKLGISEMEIRQGLDTTHTGNGLYIVNDISPSLNDKIETLCHVSQGDRSLLATQNLSHNKKVGRAHALLRQGVSHPYVVVFNENGAIYPDSHSPEFSTLLIIENEYCYLEIERTVSFLEKECGLENLSTTDIMYGSGNRCTDSLIKEMYDKYSHIYLFFDLDKGGLNMASSILNLTKTPCEFVTPFKLDVYLNNVFKNASEATISRAYDLGTKHPELEVAATAIINNRKEFEQEGYIHAHTK